MMQVVLRQGLRSLTLSSTRTIKLARPCLVPALRRHASLIPPSSTQAQASAPELQDSLNRIVPDSMFLNVLGARSNAALPRNVGRSVVGIVLLQLRGASETKSLEQEQEEADAKVNRELVKATRSLADLHAFATLLIRSSTDPRRQPIAFRLFAIAHGVDPMSTPDPTVSTSAPQKEGERPTLAAPGYSWASMVLQGSAPPPLGFHLLPPDSYARTELRTAQQAAAVRMYATLAMRGDAMGLLGMGRVLLGGLGTEKKNEDHKSVKEKRDVRDKVKGMWRRAAEAGVGEAWFELGVLELSDAPGQMRDVAAAKSHFALGAQANNARSHHALGVLLSQDASSLPSSSSSATRKELLDRSLMHFISGAELGDAQSAHNAGLRFLLREEMLGEVSHQLGSDATTEQVSSVAKARHVEKWGVEASDTEARKWFQRAADLGSLPASLNLAGMLVEDRGSLASSSSQESDHLTTRLGDLQAAEKLYMRVMGLTSLSDAPEAKQMADFARETAESVKAMIKELVETRSQVAKASQKDRRGE